MDALRFDDSPPETPTESRRYIDLLKSRGGKLTLEECRSLWKELNDFLIPFRDGRAEPEEGTFLLLLMLDGNTNSKGPLDSIKAFVAEFGSPEAKLAFEKYRPRVAFLALASEPPKKPVNVETVCAYIKFLLRTWTGLT